MPQSPDVVVAAHHPAHLYVHVPYCAAKCPYCDFNSIAGRDDEHRAYVAALLAEIRRLPRGPYRTIFIGGGTPTILKAPLLGELLHGLRQHVDLAPDYEWTCEANPGSADAERFAILAEHGVNRLSLGVQSTHDQHLRLLGRVHNADEAERALDLATRAVPRVSADLIMGVPGQTIEQLRADIGLYKRHHLQHASLYHLTYEPGTEFHAQRERGKMHDIDSQLSRDMYEVVWDELAHLGLELYETSNFAAPGHESRHNLAYWYGADYHAAGAGAVSTVNNRRVTREKHPAKYITAITQGENAWWKDEIIAPNDRIRETWMLGLRLARGVAHHHLQNAGDNPERYRPRVQALIDNGLLHDDGQFIRLTRAGRPVQDEVTVYVMP
jgi:oxygen-independent coproporphyrinogen III oxidase